MENLNAVTFLAPSHFYSGLLMKLSHLLLIKSILCVRLCACYTKGENGRRAAKKNILSFKVVLTHRYKIILDLALLQCSLLPTVLGTG